MSMPIFIELSQQCQVTHYDATEFDGQRTETVFESVFIASDHIVQMFSSGKTRLKLTTGENITVRETPAEIIEKLAGQPARGGK